MINQMFGACQLYDTIWREKRTACSGGMKAYIHNRNNEIQIQASRVSKTRVMQTWRRHFPFSVKIDSDAEVHVSMVGLNASLVLDCVEV